MAEPEELDETAPTSARGGLSASAWAALAALGAAAITGLVTLVTHFLPPPDQPEAQDQQSVAAASSAAGGSGTTARPSTSGVDTPTPSPGSAPRSGLLERVAGTWSGPAQSGSQHFTMTLVITSTCVEGGPCGTLTTDLLPCVGYITLVKIDDGPALDFAIGSYTEDSSTSCETTTGGDYFKLGDDVLSYATGYDGGLRGRLHRVG